MKGTFTLKLGKSQFLKDDLVFFGNLGRQYHDDELSNAHAVGNIVNRTDNNEIEARIIAHDIIEHTVSHRTAETVSMTEEMRAFGAIHFVRGHETPNLPTEFADLFRYAGCEISPPPPISVECEFPWTVKELQQYLEEEGIQASNEKIQLGIANFNYGYWQKSKQYEDNHVKANDDYHTLVAWVSTILYEFKKSCKAKVVVHFDTARSFLDYRLYNMPDVTGEYSLY